VNKASTDQAFNLSLPPGITAVAQIVLPKDCKGNKFCEICKMIVGPTIKWYIAGEFQWRKIKVAVGFKNIRLFAGLYFHKLELYVEVSYRKHLSQHTFRKMSVYFAQKRL